jgi:hypothetical protein
MRREMYIGSSNEKGEGNVLSLAVRRERVMYWQLQ